jgi:hypothetical protein
MPARSAALDEDERPEITVARHKDSILLLGHTQQLGVLRLGQPQLSSRNNIMPQAAQKAQCAGIDILVSEKSRGVVAR